MALSKLKQSDNSLPLILSLAAGGIILLSIMTYVLVNRPSRETQLEQLTVPVKEETLTIEIQASGTVEPIQNVNVSPKNPGRLAKLLVEQGSIVKAGQPLAIMENQEVYAEGLQAQAQLQEALAQLQEARVKLEGDLKVLSAQIAQSLASLEEAKRRIPLQIEQARAQLRETESRLNLAKTQVERNQKLLQEGAISQDRFDEIVSEYLRASANIQEILQRLEELKATEAPEISRLEAAAAEMQMSLEERKQTGKAEIQRLEASIQAARANLERVKVRYQDTFIRAPFDGIVTQKYATEGAFVTPTTSASSTASATSTSIIALAKGLEVIAKVPEIDLSQIKLGQKAKIVADAYPNRTFAGFVTRIAPEAVVEENVTSFEVSLGLATGQEQLLSKMNVEVTFLGEQIDGTIVIPTVSIVTKAGKTGVMIAGENDEPEFQPVTIGITVGDRTQVLSGLAPGDRIFLDLPD